MREQEPQPAPPDLKHFLSRIKRDFGGILAPQREITIARAPARLDIMGGIADYSGSIVVESTLQEATLVAVQKRTDQRILIKSQGAEKEGLKNLVEFYLADLYQDNGLKPLETLRALFNRDPKSAWAAYILGFFPLLIEEGICEAFSVGANIAVESTVPLGAGVASSAALEVAGLLALQHAFDLEIQAERLPLLCQKVENHLVGAPCGVMDQMTCALGEKGKLLSIRCQPAEIIGTTSWPRGYQFVGINSGVKHSVGGSRYTDTRTAAFMGRKIILGAAEDANTGDELPFGGYLCNINPDLWQTKLKKKVPARMRGQEFLKIYTSHDDPVTRIDPEKTYTIRRCTEHPILENARVEEFLRLIQLQSDSPNEEQLIRAGELMYESHASYSKNCSLGAPETDLLVNLIQEQGATSGLYGAKITGGGSGGTVAVLMADGQEGLLRNIVSLYADSTGLQPDLFFHSSPGALHLGVTQTQFE
ncbi:GHMP kinase [candidate division KSB1 bacterium]|nr:GHMP kinase [candidate division KSB1 bacterium]